MTGKAEYTFVPWAREGFRPSAGGDGDDGEGTLDVELTVDGQGNGESTDDTASVELSLYGPGEVTGIDRRQVVRTEPTPGTSDFPPNHFPMVELDHPQLPWLFSPDAEDDDGQFRPWFSLITVENKDGVTVTTGTDGPAATLNIQDPATPGEQLPDPTESWAWAHSQVVGATEVKGELETDRSEKTLSRLLSPRDLEELTDYYACIVPTYEAGRLAGLGEEPVETVESENGEGTEEVRVTGDAWDPDHPPGRIRLPVYYHWEFSTGKAGDFESLVRRLDPQVLEGVGVKQVDAGDPGPQDLHESGEVVTLEGALRSAGVSPDTYSDDPRDELVDVLDRASALTSEWAVPDEPGDDRILGPPIYGQWPPAAETVPEDDEMPEWLRDLNEDPRFRIPAAFGTEVVRDQQEQLMAEAWRQVGDIRAANEALRRARLARAASQPVHDAMETLDPAAMLALTEPAHRRVRDDDLGETLAAAVEDSAVPSATLSPAFRRITRPNGPLSRRLGGVRRERIVEDANDRELDLGDDGSPPDGTQTIGEDVAGDLCNQARAAEDPLEEWRILLGPDDDPMERFPDLVGDACRTTRKQIDDALQHLDPGDPGYEELEGLGDILSPICGEGDRRTELEKLSRALESDEWGEVVPIVRRIEDLLRQVVERLASLEAEAEDSSVLAGLLRDEDIVAVIEEFLTLMTIVEIGLLRDGLFAYSCKQADSALASLSFADERASALLADLQLLCRLVCGEDGAGGLLAAIEQNDPRRLRRIVRTMGQLVAIARGRLAALEEVDHDQDLTDLHDIGMYVEIVERRLSEAPWDPVPSAVGRRACPRPVADPKPSLDLAGAAGTAHEAMDPSDTIPARVGGQLDGLDIEDREYPLAPIMAHPEYDEATFRSLRDLSQEYLVPGVDEIPLDSIGLLETNPEFIESYMIGLSHEMARELRWHEYPTDMRGTYFRQFWDPDGRDPPLEGEERKDIEYVHEWDHGATLGKNYAAKMAAKGEDDGDDEDASGRIVLVIRGALFDRYPNTHVYAAKGREATENEPDALRSYPKLPDPLDDSVDGEVEHPIFRGTLDPDITFFGFDLDHEEAVGDRDADDHGWFFVIEEPPSGPSFGLDVAVERDEEGGWTWQDLTWDDVTSDQYVRVVGETPSGEDVPDPADLPETHDWAKNGAHMGAITWIRPFRAAIHADDMLPPNGGSQ
jgi:hypothetical protein